MWKNLNYESVNDKEAMGQELNPASFELVSIDLTEAVSGKSVGYPNTNVSIQYTKKKEMVAVFLSASVLMFRDI